VNFDKRAARVAIVIPAFNEEEAISAVVLGISAYGTAVVVNDGSTDDTGHVAGTAGALVVSHAVNLGYDNALATGLEKAVAERFDYAITLDGDGQHDPLLIESFLFELMDGADLVLGIRDRYQRVSEKIFAKTAKILWGISDPLCGMKGYRLSKLKSIDSMCTYPSIGTELAIRAVRSGWNIRQVAVKTRERNGKSRFGAGLYANWLILRAMVLGLFRAKAQTAQSEEGV
jgi:glycosyltransferase involved in cell wall biosynthesis